MSEKPSHSSVPLKGHWRKTVFFYHFILTGMPIVFVFAHWERTPRLKQLLVNFKGELFQTTEMKIRPAT
jgi:hypothetical protein